jgi:hypothetical protein
LPLGNHQQIERVREQPILEAVDRSRVLGPTKRHHNVRIVLADIRLRVVDRDKLRIKTEIGPELGRSLRLVEVSEIGGKPQKTSVAKRAGLCRVEYRHGMRINIRE